MTDKELFKLALEALENSVDLVSNEAREAEKMYANVPTRLARVQGLVALEVAHEKAITALKERLADHHMREVQRLGQEIEQEPVAYLVLFEGAGKLLEFTKGNYLHRAKVEHIPLYTHPPQRTEPICPECKAEVLYECVACSSNNYPPQRTEQEPVGALILGGIIDTSDGFEYEGWDVEWDAKVIEALQEKLVTSDSVEVMLYTHPPQRTWVGLTFAEICECENDYLHLFARAIEAKLKQKNGYAEEKNT